MTIRKKNTDIFEKPGSKIIKEWDRKQVFFYIFSLIELILKEIGGRRFNFFVNLFSESLKEWRNKKGLKILNPSALKTIEKADLESKKVIAVDRHSYEKGLDRLLLIWQKEEKKHQGWTLEIYGKTNDNNH